MRFLWGTRATRVIELEQKTRILLPIDQPPIYAFVDEAIFWPWGGVASTETAK